MDIKKEREAYEAWASKNIENFIDAVFDGKYFVMHENSRLKQKEKEFLILSLNRGFSAWIERAKAQVPEGFVLVSKEIPDSVVDRLRYSSYHWGDGTRDYFTPVYQMMIEAQEPTND